jgi:hypothetical protein
MSSTIVVLKREELVFFSSFVGRQTTNFARPSNFDGPLHFCNLRTMALVPPVHTILFALGGLRSS